MAVPYSCDALLPTAERFASPKFRRLARSFNPYKLDYAEAVELVAFLDMVPLAAAKFIFMWEKGLWGIEAARKLVEHPPLIEGAQPLIAANRAVVGLDDGLMVLSAMREGGWRRGSVPEVVTQACQELRKRGWTLQEIADECGVNREQTKSLAKVRAVKKHGIGPLFAS